MKDWLVKLLVPIALALGAGTLQFAFDINQRLAVLEWRLSYYHGRPPWETKP